MDVEQRALVLAPLTALPTLRVLWSQGQAYPTHEDEEWEIVRILRKRQIGKSYEYKRPFFRRGKSIVGQPSGSIVTHNTGISFNVTTGSQLRSRKDQIVLCIAVHWNSYGIRLAYGLFCSPRINLFLRGARGSRGYLLGLFCAGPVSLE